jgi:hypothetical protein
MVVKTAERGKQEDLPPAGRSVASMKICRQLEDLPPTGRSVGGTMFGLHALDSQFKFDDSSTASFRVGGNPDVFYLSKFQDGCTLEPLHRFT